VLSSVYLVLELCNGPEEMHRYAYFITLHLSTGILTRMFLDSVRREPGKILVSDLHMLKWISLNGVAWQSR